MKPEGYDPACEDLALHFLEEDGLEHLKRDLAQHIQDAVEDWFDTSCSAAHDTELENV